MPAQGRTITTICNEQTRYKTTFPDGFGLIFTLIAECIPMLNKRRSEKKIRQFNLPIERLVIIRSSAKIFHRHLADAVSHLCLLPKLMNPQDQARLKEMVSAVLPSDQGAPP